MRVMSETPKPIPNDVFKDFNPDEHPPYENWIMREAGDHLDLADLIERREILSDDIVAAGGLHKLDAGARLEIDGKRVGLNYQIQAKRTQYGLDEPQH